MSEGKWIGGLHWETPTIEAARIILKNRLTAVLHCLPPAVESAAEDVEHVHQLRVATRRAGAALALFDLCAPSKPWRAARKQLRRLRRAAGAARDWDVFQIMLDNARALQSEEGRPAGDLLRGVAAARRSDAQARLARAAHDCGPAFEEACEALLDQLEEPARKEHRGCFGELAHARLGEFVEKLNQAVATPNSYDELHQIRIRGKHVRYAVELFADCFDRPLRDRIYPTLEEAQDILGNITDSHIAAEQLLAVRGHLQSYRKEEWPRFKKGLEALLQTQKRRFPQERKRYLAWLPGWDELLQEFPLDKLALEELVGA